MPSPEQRQNRVFLSFIFNPISEAASAISRAINAQTASSHRGVARHTSIDGLGRFVQSGENGFQGQNERLEPRFRAASPFLLLFPSSHASGWAFRLKTNSKTSYAPSSCHCRIFGRFQRTTRAQCTKYRIACNNELWTPMHATIQYSVDERDLCR